MKVILLQDVPNTGRKYDVVEVASGYGLNYLLPQGMARTATESNLKALEAQKRAHEEMLAKRREELAERLSEIADMDITISANANEQGELYAGIHNSDIAEKINKSSDIDLEDGFIKLEHPIKKVGDYDVDVQVEDRQVSVHVEVVASDQ